jgi:hypothetical protein
MMLNGGGSARAVLALQLGIVAELRRVEWQHAQVCAASPAVPDERVQVRRACLCGQWIDTHVTSSDARALEAVWPRLHASPGCRPCAVATAIELRHERSVRPCWP